MDYRDKSTEYLQQLLMSLCGIRAHAKQIGLAYDPREIDLIDNELIRRADEQHELNASSDDT